MPATITSSPYTVLIGGVSYPIRSDNFSLKLTAGAEGKHRTSSCKVSLRGSSILQNIMQSSGLIDAVVRDPLGNTIFTGVIRPYASVTASQMYLEDFQLEILDYTEKLHQKVYENPENENIEISEDVILSQPFPDAKVCLPEDKEHSIVHILCGLCGITDISAPEINVSLYGFELLNGDYIDELLADVLYEYVYDFRFDENGKLIVFQSGPICDPVLRDEHGNPVIHEIDNAPQTISKFINSLKISRSDESKDGALVTYPKYETKSDVQLYSSEKSGDSHIVNTGTTWWDQYVTWDKSGLKSAKKIQLTNFWISFSNTSSGLAGTWCDEKEVTDCTQTGGHVYCRVGQWWGIFGNPKARIRVYADAKYLTDDTKQVGYAGTDSEEYTAQYIQELEYATSLANAIRSRAKYGNFSYTFQSFEKYEPGCLVILDEKDVSGITATARIISREMVDNTGLYKYEAEGYGAVTFSTPSLDVDKTPVLPQDEPDFITLTVNEDLILPDDALNIPVIAIAGGAIFDKYNSTPVWYLNSVPLSDLTGLAISIDRTRFSKGSNRLKLSAVYEGEEYSLEYVIKCIASDIEVSVEYTICEPGKQPDGSSVWTAGQPTPEDGQIVWIRFKTSADGEWIVLRMTGENGGNPVVYFRWAATPYTAPDAGYDLLVWGTTAFGWELSNGQTMGFAVNSGAWSSVVPTERPAGCNYLWVKYYNYQTKSWDYFCTTGTPAQSFDLEVNPQTFKLTSRGVIREDAAYDDSCQRIIVRCIKINTNAPCSWAVGDEAGQWNNKAVPDLNEVGVWHLIVADDDSEIEIVLNPGYALSAFTIRCTIADIQGEKSFLCSGIQIGKAEVAYLGVYPSYEQLTQVDSMSEGDLMVGDHALVRPAGSTGTPYYWNGQSWVKADGSTPSDIAWIVLKNTLYDATHSGNETESMSVIDLFASNFAAYNAFIENLGAHYIKIFKQGAIYGGCFNADGSVKEDDTSGLGFHLNSDGFLQAFKALLQDVSITSYSQDKKEIILATQKGQAPSEAFNVADVTPEYFETYEFANAYLSNDYKWEIDPSTVSDDMPVAYNHGDDEKVCLFSTRNTVSGSSGAMTLSFSIGSIPKDYGSIIVRLQTTGILFNSVTIQHKRNGSIINTYYVNSNHSETDVYGYMVYDALAGDEFLFSITKLTNAYIEIRGKFCCELIKTKRGMVTDSAGTKYYVYGLDSPIESVYDENDYVLKNDSNTYPGMDPSFSCYQYFNPYVRYIKYENLQGFFLNNTVEGNNFCSSSSFIRMDKDDSKKYVVTNIIREEKKATVRYINSYGYEVGWTLYLDRDEYDWHETELYIQFTNNPASLLTASLIPSEENNSKYDVGSSTNPYRCVFTKGLHFAVIATSPQGLSEGDVYVDSNNNLKVVRS